MNHYHYTLLTEAQIPESDAWYGVYAPSGELVALCPTARAAELVTRTLAACAAVAREVGLEPPSAERRDGRGRGA